MIIAMFMQLSRLEKRCAADMVLSGRLNSAFIPLLRELWDTIPFCISVGTALSQKSLLRAKTIAFEALFERD